MPEHIIRYRTKDGQTFDEFKDADEHEKHIDRRTIALLIDDISDYGPNAITVRFEDLDKIIDVIVKDYELVPRKKLFDLNKEEGK